MIWLKALFAQKAITAMRANYEETEHLHQLRIAGAFVALKAMF